MAGTTFDVRGFISPPYIKCPMCGNDALGVLGPSISARSYSRRCKVCLHLVDRYPLPELRKKIVYLDQYVISNLMKLENPALQRNDSLKTNPFWQVLHSLLMELRGLQLIVCPDSASHVAESRISPFNAELKKMYEHLSSGTTFNAFQSIRSRQIGELARAWAENREPAFNFEPRSVLSKDPNEWAKRYYMTFQDNPFIIPDEIKASRAHMHSAIARIFTDVWAKKKHTFQEWYDLERQNYQRNVALTASRAIQRREQTKVSILSGAPPSLEELAIMMPSEQEALLNGVMEIMRFPRSCGERTPQEVGQLLKDFSIANRIAEAPFIKLQSLMYAAIAMRASAGQKEPPNEGMTTDIETVAHLLPYCDSMLMDKDCRALLLNVPTALRPSEVARVYSLSNRDEFLAHLRSIRDSITPEHVSALSELYGEDRLPKQNGVS